MADAGLILAPTNRIVDVAGATVPGGTLEFYAAGTTTPKTVYSDAGLTVSLGATVYLDSGGHPVASQGSSTKVVIYSGSALIKIVSKDANGTTLATYDNVRVAQDTSGFGTGSGGGGLATSVVSKTADFTVQTTQNGYLFACDPTGGIFTATLPDAVTVGDGFELGLQHAGTTTANAVKWQTVSSQTVTYDGTTSTAGALTGGGETVWFVSNGAGWRISSRTAPRMPHMPVTVASRTNSPPTAPNAGAWYIINGAPTGLWGSYANGDLVRADGQGGWIRYRPVADSGWLAYVQDENYYYSYQDSAWVALSNATANPVSALEKIIVEHQLPAGTAGDLAATSGTGTKTLNTVVVNTVTGASLATNKVTLPTGNYIITGWVSCYQTAGGGNGNIKFVLRDSSSLAQYCTTPMTELRKDVNSPGSGYINSDQCLSLGGAITVTAATQTLELVYVNTATNVRLGQAYATGAPEVYASLTFLKVDAKQGPKGDKGDTGTNGTDPGMRWQVSTTTTMADPGAGKLRFNNATMASVTAIAISATNAESGNPNVRTWVLTWDDSGNVVTKGQLIVKDSAAPQTYAVFDITGATTDNTGWLQLAVTHANSAGTWTNNNYISVSQYRSGEPGTVNSVFGRTGAAITATVGDYTTALVTHTPGDTGAVARTMYALLQSEHINVESYRDGTRDHHQMIATALAAAKTRGGGTVFIPDGDWTIAKQSGSNLSLKIPSNTKLVMGMNCKIKSQFDAANYDTAVFRNDDITTGNSNVWIVGGAIQQYSDSYSGNIFVTMNKVDGFRMIGTRLLDIGGRWRTNFRVTNSVIDGVIVNSEQSGWTTKHGTEQTAIATDTNGQSYEDGLHFLGGSSNVVVGNCIIDSGDDCIALNIETYTQFGGADADITDFQITNCRLKARWAQIIRLYCMGTEGGLSAVTSSIKRVLVSNCTGYAGVNSAGVYVSVDGTGGIARNCYENIRFHNLDVDCTATTNVGGVNNAGIDIDRAKDIELTNCRFYNPYDTGISIRNTSMARISGGRLDTNRSANNGIDVRTSCANIHIDGVTIRGLSNASSVGVYFNGVTDGSVRNCDISGCGSNGIELATSTGIAVTGNRVASSGGYSFAETGTSDYNRIIGNDFRTGSLGNIYTAALGPNSRYQSNTGSEDGDSAGNTANSAWINGVFQVWQVGTGSTSSAAGSRTYLADMTFVNPAGAAVTQQLSTSLPTGTFSANSLQVTGAASVTTVNIGQRIEAAMGVIYKRQVTFSARIYNGTGGAFTPSLLLGTPSATDNFTTVTNRLTQGLQSCANGAWTKVYWTVDVSGYTNIGNGLQVEIQIPSGSLDNGSKSINITDVFLVPGLPPGRVVAEPYQSLLTKCLRHYQDHAVLGGGGIASGATTVARWTAPLSVPMRAAPTITLSGLGFYDGTNIGTVSSVAADYSSSKYIQLDMSCSGASFTTGRAVVPYDPGSSSIKLNARL